MRRLHKIIVLFCLQWVPALACLNDSDLGATERGLKGLVPENFSVLHPSLGVLVPCLGLLAFFWVLDRRK